MSSSSKYCSCSCAVPYTVAVAVAVAGAGAGAGAGSATAPKTRQMFVLCKFIPDGFICQLLRKTVSLSRIGRSQLHS